MSLKHPIDEEIRDRLRKLGPHQTTLAKRIGRSQGWLNKYMNGSGTATVDDVIRIAATFIDVVTPSLSEFDRRLLRALNQIPETSRLDALEFFEHHARLLRRGRSQRPAATTVHTPQETVDSRHEKR